MNYLDTLNDAQRNAVMATEGPVLVIAGAGSGKTRVLTMRVAYLLEQGVAPYNILALTFTNKAAREMKERIAQIVGDETASQLWMGTFHSIFARILRFEADVLGLNRDFTIYDSQDSKNVIKHIIKEMGLDDKTYKLSTVASAISQAKNDLVSPQMYANNSNYIERDKAAKRPRTVEIYSRYNTALHKSNALDFDDLLFSMHILLRDHEDVLQKYQNRFRYVMVDEYQDTNMAQYVIVKRLVEKHRNLCVVGDDAQSIYSFRGARIENILGLGNDYADLQVFKLEQNYRSTQKIVGAANSLIEHNNGRLKKTVFSMADEGEPIRICSAQSDTDEAALVCRDIALRMRNEGLVPSDFAVLYRTNAQSRAFEDSFRKNHVPYKIFGGLAFYQRKEIKDLLAYFRLAVNHDDSESLRRIINYPARGIGQTTVDKLSAFASAHDTNLWNAMQPASMAEGGLSAATASKVSRFASLIEMFSMQSEQLNAYEFAAEVLSQSGIMKDLNDSRNDAEGKERYDNVNELMNTLKGFAETRLESGEDTSIRAYLEEVALISDLDSDNTSNQQVRLMTIHSSKGLEFRNVYIVGVEQETFPGQNCSTDVRQMEEERRLFYVALTRAKISATISYCLTRFQYGERRFCHPSCFIADIDREYVERPESLNADRPRSSFSYSRPLASGGSSAPSAYSRPQGYQRPMQSSFRRTSPMPSQFKPASQISSVAAPSGDTFAVGMRVVHETFGRGVIEAIEGSMPNTKLKIIFDNVGSKLLLLKFARLRPE